MPTGVYKSDLRGGWASVHRDSTACPKGHAYDAVDSKGFRRCSICRKAQGRERVQSPALKSWGMMLQRCTNPKRSNYRYYGGRGITVCDRWNPKAGGSFANFLEDMGDRPEGRTLDRTNVDGHYEPANCRWATPAEQLANRRRAKSKEKEETNV